MGLLGSSFLSSCTVNPAQDVVDDSISCIVTPKAVTNVKASTCEEGQITLTFDGQNDADGLNLYYNVRYQEFEGAKAIGAWKQAEVSSTMGDTSFSKTFTVPSGIHMLFAIDTVIKYPSGKSEVKLVETASSVVEGASLPSIAIDSPIVDGNNITLSWDDSALMSAMDQSGKTPLYNYEFEVYRQLDGAVSEPINVKKDTTFSEYCSGNQVQPTYLIKLILLDAHGDPLEDVPAIESSVTVVTDASTAPAAPLAIQASRGTHKEGITVTWTLPDYIDGIDTSTVSHRAKVEKSVHDSGNWTTVVDLKEDINDASTYGYVTTGDGGSASYSFVDGDIEANTLYDYKVTAAYCFSSTGIIQTQDKSLPAKETEKPGYRTWLAEDLKVIDQRASLDGKEKDQNPNLDTLLVWTYDEPSGAEGTFQLVRSDEYGSVTIDDVSGASYTDNTYSLSEEERRMNHSWRYSLRLKYADGTYSDAITGDTTVEFVTQYTQVKYIQDLSATHNLAGKVKLTWTKEGDDEITYTLQQAPSYEALSSAESEAVTFDLNEGKYSYTISSEAGKEVFCKLTATYSGDKQQNTTYVQVVSGKALATPSSLKVDDAISQTTLTGSFSPVAEAYSYQVGYRESDSDGEYTFVNIDKTSPSFSLSSEVGAGTEEAGKVYDFVVRSVDETGEVTEVSAVEKGSLFGPYGLNPLASDNDATNNSFTVAWNPIQGSDGYRVVVYRDDEDRSYVGSKLVETVTGSTGYSQSFLSSDSIFNVTETNPYPLSSRYLVKVVPYSNTDSGEISEDLISYVECHWFAPPVLAASKAASGTQITVTWNTVEGAENYLLYQSTDGKSWGSPTTLSSSETSKTFTTTSDTYFTIASQKGGLKSQLQSYAQGDDTNFGYVFKAPSSFNATSNADKPYYTLVWSAVEGATGYYLKQAGASEVLVDVSSIAKGGSSGTSGSEGYLSLSADGTTYTLLYHGAEIEDPSDYLKQFAIRSAKTIDSKEVSSEWSGNTSNVYRLYDTREILNAVCFVMYTHLHAANDQFGGDWWPNDASIGKPDQRTYTSSDGSAVIKSVKASWWSGAQEAGSVVLSLAPVGTSGIKVSTISCPSTYAVDEGAAGYLGTDPLKTVGTGSFTVALPANPFGSRTAVVTITQELNVIDKTGSFSVSFDGETKSYSYADLSVMPY